MNIINIYLFDTSTLSVGKINTQLKELGLINKAFFSDGRSKNLVILYIEEKQ